MAEKILQCGYMSGDTYAAAACLALYPGSTLLLIQDTKERQDKTGTIGKIYRECGVGASIKVRDLSKSTLKVKECWNAIKDKYKDGAPAPARRPAGDLNVWLASMYNEKPIGWPRSITAVTGLVASQFESNADAPKTVATAWKIGKLPTDMKFALWEYMAGKFRQIKFEIRNNIVVLWSRQSAKHGGAHLEMDSSYAAIRQLAARFSQNATVLLTGDERNGKLAQIAAKYGNTIDVSNMWEAKSPIWRKETGEADNSAWGQKFAGNTYLAQFAFYKELAGDYNVIHLGMRSGMLESMALLGMKTFYMEPTNCGSGDRMLAFSTAGIPYSRIQIGALPGLKSRAAQQIIEKDKQPVATLGMVDYRIRDITNDLMKQPGFLQTFGGYNPRTRKYYPTQEAREAATKLAKVGAAGDDTGTVNLANIDEKVAAMRGFLDDDLKKIVAQVEAAFKHS